MGVSGSGKTTIGKLLAKRLRCQFADADDFHSAGNKAKMKSGTPLNDDDRRPWLKTLADLIDKHVENKESLVLACSALKHEYRSALSGTNEVLFVYLKVDFETIEKRLKTRHHEFMNPDLLKSQFATLEEPADAVIVDASQEPDLVVDQIALKMS